MSDHLLACPRAAPASLQRAAPFLFEIPAPVSPPLFYRSVVPFDCGRYRKAALPAAPSYRFAAASHLVPAVADEFAAASGSLPVLFAPSGESVTPVFLTGVEPGRNSFVAADGGWTGAYLPLYLRRYPFILGDVAGDDLLLCIDEQAESLRPMPSVVDAGSAAPRRTEGVGPMPLFHPDGANAPALDERLRLAATYAAAERHTRALCRLLVEFDLLRPAAACRVGTAAPNGERAPHRRDGASGVLHDLLAVNAAALSTLSPADYRRLRDDDHLEAVYGHLDSLRAIALLPG